MVTPKAKSAGEKRQRRRRRAQDCVCGCVFTVHTLTQRTHVHVTPHPCVNKMQARNGRVHRTNFGGSPQSELRSLRYVTPNRKCFCTWTFKPFSERMVLYLNIICPRACLSMDLSICVSTCIWQPGAIPPRRIASCRRLMYAYVHLPLSLSLPLRSRTSHSARARFRARGARKCSQRFSA